MLGSLRNESIWIRSLRRSQPYSHDAETVRDLFELAEDGRTPAQIAELANRRDGGRSDWSARRILQILSNPIYAGFLPGEAKQVGNHEAIVTPEQFDRVCEQVQARRNREPQKRTSGQELFPLRGLLYCGTCGRALNTNTSTRESFRYRWYQCRSHAGGRPPCRGVSLRAQAIEEFVVSSLYQAAIEPGVEKLFGDDWKTMVMAEQQAIFKDFIAKIEYDKVESDSG